TKNLIIESKELLYFAHPYNAPDSIPCLKSFCYGMSCISCLTKPSFCETPAFSHATRLDRSGGLGVLTTGRVRDIRFPSLSACNSLTGRRVRWTQSGVRSCSESW